MVSKNHPGEYNLRIYEEKKKKSETLELIILKDIGCYWWGNKLSVTHNKNPNKQQNPNTHTHTHTQKKCSKYY